MDETGGWEWGDPPDVFPVPTMGSPQPPYTFDPEARASITFQDFILLGTTLPIPRGREQVLFTR